MGNVPDSWIAALDGVLELGALLQRDQSESLAQMGLTTSRAHALWILGHGGPMTHRDLAESLGVVPRSVTDLVDALESLALVTRGRHPVDRRASVITLTATGHALVKRLQREHQRFAQVLFADMPPRELVAFTRSMTRLLTTLRPLVPGPTA